MVVGHFVERPSSTSSTSSSYWMRSAPVTRRMAGCIITASMSTTMRKAKSLLAAALLLLDDHRRRILPSAGARIGASPHRRRPTGVHTPSSHHGGDHTSTFQSPQDWTRRLCQSVWSCCSRSSLYDNRRCCTTIRRGPATKSALSWGRAGLV